MENWQTALWLFAGWSAGLFMYLYERMWEGGIGWTVLWALVVLVDCGLIGPLAWPLMFFLLYIK